MLESIPYAEAEEARAQFDEYGHVSINGLFAQGLLDPATEEARNLAAMRRTHNEGQRENVTQLHPPAPEKEESLYAVLQGAQEGAAILGGALSLTHGCRLDLRQMDKRTTGTLKSNRGPYVGGVVASIALEGPSYYVLGEGDVKQEGVDYLMKPGDIIFEDLGRKLKHLSYTGDDDRTTLVIANNLNALSGDQAAAQTGREQAAQP
jgi:hypothetical protein